jgi:hypothetical protein
MLRLPSSQPCNLVFEANNLGLCPASGRSLRQTQMKDKWRMASASTSPSASRGDEQGMINDLTAFLTSCNAASSVECRIIVSGVLRAGCDVE